MRLEAEEILRRMGLLQQSPAGPAGQQGLPGVLRRTTEGRGGADPRDRYWVVTKRAHRHTAARARSM